MPAQSNDARSKANREAFDRLTCSEPVLTDLNPAIEVLPGMTAETVLTSGPPLPWEDFEGGQREALIGGALFERLAETREQAIAGFDSGRIRVGGCHDYGCVGSLAGIYTASMPVFVVENQQYGNRGYCNIYEGKSPRRLNYGVYDNEVRDRLFEPFFTTKDEIGNGLGLSIVYRIVEDHGGQIDVESEEGKGSAFELLLPVRKWPAASQRDGDEPADFNR